MSTGASPRRSGVPVWAGKYVFDANKDVVEHLRENGTLMGEQIYKHSYPALLAVEDAGRLPRGRAIFHPDRGNPRRRRWRPSIGVTGCRLGAQPHLRHRRIAARLVHLAPALLGRAAAGVL